MSGLASRAILQTAGSSESRASQTVAEDASAAETLDTDIRVICYLFKNTDLAGNQRAPPNCSVSGPGERKGQPRNAAATSPQDAISATFVRAYSRLARCQSSFTVDVPSVATNTLKPASAA